VPVAGIGIDEDDALLGLCQGSRHIRGHHRCGSAMTGVDEQQRLDLLVPVPVRQACGQEPVVGGRP
jgi:hypothetical protein